MDKNYLLRCCLMTLALAVLPGLYPATGLAMPRSKPSPLAEQPASQTTTTLQKPPRYANDFQTAELKGVPEDFLVLNGAFAVRQDGDNKYLELPGAPLESFGVLFGPAEKDGLAVSARIQGAQQGRRYPSFGVGLNGVGGHRLQVSAAKRRLELLKGDEVVTFLPYQWKSGGWTRLRLQIRQTGPEAWIVEGRAWPDGAREPREWLIRQPVTKAPYPGRASVWGQPYSGTPIRFDDLLVTDAVDP